MKKVFFTMMLAIVSSVWVMSEAQCLVPSTEQEGPFVEELTGLLCLDAYPCPYEENCPTCLTMVLRTKEKKYYLTGSVMESIDAPTDRQYVKVVVSGITGSTELGNNEYYNWLKVETLRYSEEPVTTNIRTFGYVEDESGTRLEGIRVIVHAPDRTVSDTVYTHEGGEFVSTIKGIVYPVDSMYVTVSDVSERFKEQTKSTTYTYECGVEFNPETDTGLNSKELLFVLQEKTPSSERWCMPQMATREGKITRIGGPLREESTPCYESEEEPCLPCLTVALRAGGTTYYLVSGDAQVIATLDTLSAGAPVIVDGVAFKEDKYTYMQVCHIEPVIVSEFQKRLMGNWQVYKPVPDLGEEGANEVSWWNIDATTIDEQGFSTDNWGPRPTYSLHEQEDGTWLMTVYNLYQSSCQSEESWLTITIHKLTEDRMEWEYDSHYEYLWRYPHKEDPDTIPLYIKDGPGTSTVEPVDPNQIIVTLNGDKLTIHEYLGTEISYVLTKAPSGNNMPARNREMASDTFSESVSIQLTESGLYTLTLTSPEWSYSIVGTFEYDAPQGVEIVETSVPAAQKILRNGQLFIRKGDRTYTVQGIEIRE